MRTRSLIIATCASYAPCAMPMIGAVMVFENTDFGVVVLDIFTEQSTHDARSFEERASIAAALRPPRGPLQGGCASERNGFRAEDRRRYLLLLCLRRAGGSAGAARDLLHGWARHPPRPPWHGGTAPRQHGTLRLCPPSPIWAG